MADPGFPVGGRGPRGGGRGLPRWLRFRNFVCQNERIGTLRGCAPGTPPRSANDIYKFRLYSISRKLRKFLTYQKTDTHRVIYLENMD